MASAVSNLQSVLTASGNDRFNKEAEQWDSRPLIHKLSKAAYEAIFSRLKTLDIQTSNLQVLEIGCGTGVLSFLVAPHVERVVAVDAADGMIDVLKDKLRRPESPKNILPVAVLLEDPEDAALPMAAGGGSAAHVDGRQKFDLITSHLVLHHIPDLRSVLKTMLGCLKPGGRVMLTDFHDFGPEAKRFHPRSRMSGVQRHGIKIDEMTALLKEAGFVNANVKVEWSSSKEVERYEGEFEESGDSKDGKGEQMEFPFLLCYGERPAV